jgi:hypothetical protein
MYKKEDLVGFKSKLDPDTEQLNLVPETQKFQQSISIQIISDLSIKYSNIQEKKQNVVLTCS